MKRTKFEKFLVSIVTVTIVLSAFAAISFGVTGSSVASAPSPLSASQPNPSSLGFTFTVTPTWGYNYHVGDVVVATVKNFPAFQQAQIFLGPVSIGSISTNSTGAGQLTTTVPAMPGGSYYPNAQVSSQGLYVQASQVTIAPYFEIMDPSGRMLNVSSSVYEYVPVNGSLTVKAFGLSPGTAYDATDQLAASSGVFESNLVTSVSIGTASSSGIYPASNGNIAFTYRAAYTTHTTSTVSNIVLTGVSSFKGQTFAYKTIGQAVISSPSSFSVQTGGSSRTLTVSGLIPYESTVYPGVSYSYSAYIGTRLLSLTFSSTTSSKFYATGGTFTGTFTVPSTSGVFKLNVTYYGSSYSKSLGSQYVIISSAGSSPTSGALSVFPMSGNYEIVGYGYENTPVPTLYYMTYSGSHSIGLSIANGAFAVSFAPGTQPAGKYSVFTKVTASSTNYFVYSSYTISPSFTISSPLLDSSTPGGPVGSTLTASATGLLPNYYYSVYFGATDETPSSYLLSDSSGTISSIGFSVPSVPEGNYNVTLIPLSSSAPVLSTAFEVVQGTGIQLSTTSQYAFPGQLVQFSLSGLTKPSTPTGNNFVVIGLPSYTVTISLNSTPFTTVPASLVSSVLYGSFLMPNNAPGSYYMISFNAFETVSAREGSSVVNYTTISLPFSGSQSDFLGLVSGNGAYILGVSHSQIAQIDSSINATLSAPLSQLNAAVSSINGNVATVSTEFGTMITSLNAINATITNIQSGVVTVVTVLGTLNTSLQDLNASVMLFDNNIAVLNTTLGQQKVTLSSINASVDIINSNTAVIRTDLGTFSGNVTSVSNGITTIQTKLGTVQTSTNQIGPSYRTSLILEIVIVVLAAIATAFSALALFATKDLRNRFGVKKE